LCIKMCHLIINLLVIKLLCKINIKRFDILQNSTFDCVILVTNIKTNNLFNFNHNRDLFLLSILIMQDKNEINRSNEVKKMKKI